MSRKEQKRIKNAIGILMAFLAMLQLAGCGRVSDEQPGATEEPDRQEVLWQGESFGEVASLTEGSPVWLVDYQEDLEGLPDRSVEEFITYDHRYFGCYQDKVHLLTNFTYWKWEERDNGPELMLGDRRYFLSTYDLGTKKRECRELNLDFDPIGGAVTNAGELIVFRKDSNFDTNEGAVEHYYAVYMDLDGIIRTMVDLYPAMQEFGMEPDPRDISEDCCDYDSRGYLYIRDPKKSRVGVIDETGALISIMEPPLERREAATCFLKTMDGIAVFGASGIKGTQKVTTLFWYDDKKSDISILGDTDSAGVLNSMAYMDQYENIYYSASGNLVRWNWRTGVREKIFNYGANGIDASASGKYYVTNEEGQLFLLNIKEDISQLYGFSETEPDYQAAIEIADICNLQDSEYILSSAASFSRKNPLIHVGYGLADHDRIINEIVSGNGPEMLIVSREEMEALYEKGVIEDLSGVLPKETEGQIYASVLEAGQIDGKQIGLAWESTGSTLYVSRDVWQKDTWSVAEFVELVEAREGELEDIFAAPIPLLQTPFVTFRYIAMMDLKNSPFIDWEKGECYFNSPLFRKTLEISMRYGKEYDATPGFDFQAFESAGIEELKEGQALAYAGLGVGSLSGFSQIMTELGEDFYSVGHPTGEKSGAFVEAAAFLVVNAKAEAKEQIYDFLRYCYDFDNQRTADTHNVRKDVMRTFVTYTGYDGSSKRWLFNVGGGAGTGTLLESKPDGSSWLEEYLEFMDNSVPLPMKSQDVYNMIWEEVQYYFDGARDIDQTIDVLQRRVQLYLDEHKM